VGATSATARPKSDSAGDGLIVVGQREYDQIVRALSPSRDRVDEKSVTSRPRRDISGTSKCGNSSGALLGRDSENSLGDSVPATKGPERPLTRPSQHLFRNTLSGTAVGGKEYRGIAVTLPTSLDLAGSTNTTFTTVQQCKPSDAPEFASLANVWDECIVDGFTYIFSSSCNLTPGGAFANAQVIAWDPINSTALGSVVNGLQHQHHFLWNLPSCAAGASGPNVFPSPQPMTKNGFYTWKWKLPKGAGARSTQSATVYSGEWSDTSSTSTTYGYLKPYLPALGSGVTVYVTGYLFYHLRFRSRS